MRKVLGSAMVTAMALCIIAAVVALGSVNQDFICIPYALGTVAVLGWAAKMFFADSVSWKHSPLHWPVLGFFVYALVRYFTSSIEYDSRLELLNVGFYVLVYFLCAANFYHSRDRTILLLALMVLVLAEAAFGIWQFWRRPETVLTFSRPSEYVGRASGTYICPNHFAGLLEIVLALLIARLAMWNPSKTAVQRIALQKVFIAYVALMVIAAQMLSFSRSSWVATCAGLITFLFWGNTEWKRLWPRLAAGAAGIGALILIATNVAPVRNYILLTFKEPSPGKSLALTDTTLGDRTILWRDTVKMISDRPTFGTGPGTWQWFHPQYQPKEMQDYAMLAHNDILNAASDYGLIGLALIIAALLCFYRHAAAFVGSGSGSDRRSFAIGSAVAVTIIVIHSWFDFNMHIPSNALLLAALMGCTVAMEDSSDRYRRVELARGARMTLGISLLAILMVGGWFAGRTALAYYHQTQGKRHKSHMYWDDALASYSRSLAIDPKAPVPYARIGDIHRSQAFWRVDPARRAERESLAREAIKAYQRSLDLNRRQVEVWLNLARAFELVGERSEAEAAYRQAISLSPTIGYLHQEFGLYYRRHGDEQRALTEFQQSLSLAWNEVAAINVQELQPR